MGTGYVYSDKYISDDDALKQFQDYLGREDLKFKKLKMRIGLHKNLWVKNVCAIGLSAGFIEPLESNGLLSVHDFLSVLVRTLERPVVSEFAKQNFNLRCHTMFRGFAEFVAKTSWQYPLHRVKHQSKFVSQLVLRRTSGC